MDAAAHKPHQRQRTDVPPTLNPALVYALQQTTLGLHRGAVRLAKYSPLWEQAFKKIQSVLNARKPNGVQAIEHIGSTAVPGLDAKPILDIAIGIANNADLDELHSWLAQEGFLYRGDADAVRPDTLYGFEIEPNVRLVNVHMITYNGTAWEHYLNFRNHLRDNTEDRKAYQQLKERLAKNNSSNRRKYLDGKTQFITQRRKA